MFGCDVLDNYWAFQAGRSLSFSESVLFLLTRLLSHGEVSILEFNHKTASTLPPIWLSVFPTSSLMWLKWGILAPLFFSISIRKHSLNSVTALFHLSGSFFKSLLVVLFISDGSFFLFCFFLAIIPMQHIYTFSAGDIHSLHYVSLMSWLELHLLARSWWCGLR